MISFIHIKLTSGETIYLNPAIISYVQPFADKIKICLPGKIAFLLRKDENLPLVKFVLARTLNNNNSEKD